MTGNRTNLLFIESCHALIKDNLSIINSNDQSVSPEQRTILEYQNAVASLQSGHYGALNTLVSKYSPMDKAYKNKLWAIFRTAATQLRLNAHIDEVINTERAATDSQ